MVWYGKYGTLTLPTFDIRVPKATLSNRVNEQVKETLGRPTELTKEEEAILVERLMILGEWGFPPYGTYLTYGT